MASQVLARAGLPIILKTLFKPLDLTSRFFFVLDERRLQILRLRRLCHLGQGFENLVFGEVDILQRVVKKVA